jgi:hypothetical protein
MNGSFRDKKGCRWADEGHIYYVSLRIGILKRYSPGKTQCIERRFSEALNFTGNYFVLSSV